MTLFPRSLSLDHLRDTLSRFPLAILSSALCTALIIWTTRANYGDVPEWVEKMIPSLFIGILLFAGLALFAERHRLRSWLIQLMGIPVLYLLVYHTNTDPWTGSFDVVALGMIFVASLALIFAGPYVKDTKEEQGFWSFGVLTTSRALTAIAAALIFVAGFNLAIVSINELFVMQVDYRWGEYLMAFFCVFIASLVFFTGIPSDYKSLQKEIPGDKAARSLALYLSFPLLTTYFLILAAYVVKILATQVWPEGFVALPVLLFTILGFGTYALVFPIRDGKSSSLIGWFSKVFPWAVLPFLLVYFIAFWKRIEPYGVTELRYLGVLMGMLLLAWALYFGIKKRASLRWIPLSLVIVGFLFSFGPWSASGVSKWSQMSRLEAVLMENGIMVDGVLVPTVQELPEGVAADISSKVQYLVDHYGTEPFEAWFGEGVTGMYAEEIVIKMGVPFEPYYGGYYDDGYTYSSFWSDTAQPAQISGYDYALSYYGSANVYGDMPPTSFELPNGDGTLEVSVASDGSTLNFVWKGQSYAVPLTEFVDTLKAEEVMQDGPMPREELSVSFEQGQFKTKIYFGSISWSTSTNGPSSLDLDSVIYLSVK